MDNKVRDDWELSDQLDQIGADARGYLNTKKDEWLLEAAERAGVISARIVLLIISLAVTGLILLFASFALSSYLSMLLGSTAQGHLAVAGIYLILTVLFRLAWKEKIRSRVIVDIVNEIYTPDDKA
jgi:hypothetical protein